MAGMRDIISHEYFGIDLSIIWETTRNDIPELKKQIEVVIKEQRDNDLFSNRP